MNTFIKKAFGLTGILLWAGMMMAQAQSVSISPSGSSVSNSFYCMDVDDTGTVFQANAANLLNGMSAGTSVVSTQYTWSVDGGIKITDGANSKNVTVEPLDGINYAAPEQYSKYAKGKLKVTCKVEYLYEYTVTTIAPCEVEPEKTEQDYYTYYVSYTSEIEIRKQFSDLIGNAITGPEFVKTDQKVTFSVAPWISLYPLNTVEFDDYYWDIPHGVAQNDVLYYSADKSSVTFVVGNNFKNQTIYVRMGACNQSNQTAISFMFNF